MKLHKPGTESEFVEMMLIVDEHLKGQGLAPYQRPMHAWALIGQRLGLQLSFPAKSRAIRSNCFDGDDLTNRIYRWYDENYGPKLSMPGVMPSMLMINDEVWRLTFPRLVGSARVFADPHQMAEKSCRSQICRGRPVEVNCLNYIEGLPQPLALQMSGSGSL